MSSGRDGKRATRAAAAGAVAGLLWRSAEPTLRRLFGHPYSDAGLVTAFVARGRARDALDYAVQVVGGATFGAAFARLGGRTLPQAVVAVLLQNGLVIAAFPLVDRVHPRVRAGEWPPLAGSPRAAAVSVSGHLLYGVALGLLSRPSAGRGPSS